MRRALAAFLVALAAGALVASTSAGGDGGYRVRAIFDNASFLISGEDVKVAGVKVGVIDHLDLTPDNKAAVVLRIDDPAFQSFRADAHCGVRLQSLIGEQYVDCQPTQARGPGVEPAPFLKQIGSGPGKGEYLLPVSRTQTPVNQDLINDIMRVPERERFRLIINDLGAGLAGNGSALRAALRRADPALQQTDHVISVLARQNRVLAQLVDDSSRVLGPLAQRRGQLAGFVAHAGATAEATAAQGDALEADLRRLPAFLQKLGPTADDFSALADQMTPALQSLNSHAAAINSTVQLLGPTARKATPALVALGGPAAHATRSLPALVPTTHKLTGLARPLLPLSSDLASLSSSFDNTGGIEDVMRFIYYFTAASNGEDALGHYLRGALNVNICSGRVSTAAPGCASNFHDNPTIATASSAAPSPNDQLLEFLMGRSGP